MRLPTFFGPYEILEFLGSGMTSVYRVRNSNKDGRTEILKVVRRSNDRKTLDVIEAETRGAELQQKLHNVAPDRFVGIYETGDLMGHFYLTMQHIRGENLSQRLARDLQLEPARAVEYVAGVCRGLEVCHGCQIDFNGQTNAVVHGDIKPANVQVDSAGRVWLLDFGSARAVTTSAPAMETLFATVEYCSAEYLETGVLNPSCDLWATAVLLYELIEGAPPFRGGRQQVENAIRSRRSPVRIGSGRCPETVWRILETALDPVPARRFQTAGEFASALRDSVAVVAAFPPHRHVLPGLDPTPTVPLHLDGPATHRRCTGQVRSGMRGKSVLPRIVGILLPVCIVGAQEWKVFVDVAPILSQFEIRSRAPEDTERNLKPASWLPCLLSPLRRAGRILRTREIAFADQEKRAGACLKEALDMVSNDRIGQGKPALCGAHLRRGAAQSATGAERAENIGKSRGGFLRAARWLPGFPDPCPGGATLYAFAAHDANNVDARIARAERAGHVSAERESAQQADSRQHRGDELTGEGNWYRTSAAGRSERKQFLIAKSEFERTAALLTRSGDIASPRQPPPG